MKKHILGSEAQKIDEMRLKSKSFDEMTKDVLTLIKAHCQKDEAAFKDAARRIAARFDKDGSSQLAHYIWGLIGDEPTWVPMDN